MATYKSEMIEFRAGRIVLTEAQWTANTNVYPEGIIAITSDGSNAGRTKVFNGTSYWSQLAYNSGGGGAVTSDDVTNDSAVVVTDNVTEAIDALAGNFAANSAAITAVSTSVTDFAGTKRYKVLLTQTGTDAPAITVQRNGLGGVPVSSYQGAGEYRVTLNGAFPVAKTTAILQYNGDAASNTILSVLVDASGNFLTIATGDGQDAQDNRLTNTCLLVEVEP